MPDGAFKKFVTLLDRTRGQFLREASSAVDFIVTMAFHGPHFVSFNLFGQGSHAIYKKGNPDLQKILAHASILPVQEALTFGDTSE